MNIEDIKREVTAKAKRKKKEIKKSLNIELGFLDKFSVRIPELEDQLKKMHLKIVSIHAHKLRYDQDSLWTDEDQMKFVLKLEATSDKFKFVKRKDMFTTATFDESKRMKSLSDKIEKDIHDAVKSIKVTVNPIEVQEKHNGSRAFYIGIYLVD